MTLDHPAGPYTVAEILTKLIGQRVPGWEEEVFETTWRACCPEAAEGGHPRFVIVATGQLHPRDPWGERPGPLIVAGVQGRELRLQLPWVTARDDHESALAILDQLGVFPEDGEE